MTEANGRFASPLLISLVGVLVISLLVSVGAVAYRRLESLAWASHRQTQIVLDSLLQRAEGVDGDMAVVLQELEALKREQAAERARLEALEAGGVDTPDLQSEMSLLHQRLDDLSAICEEWVAVREGLQRVDDGGDSQAVPAPSQDGLQYPAESSADSTSVRAGEPTSLGVPLYRQTHTLSCEAASASMVAAFYGVSLSEEEAIARLPRHENPNLGFRGDMDGSPGGLEDYGVHAGPVQTLLSEYGLQATDIRGGLEGIRSALRAGHPVIAWVTYHLWEQRPVELELAGGARAKVVPYEHTVVLDGYTADGLWALDPYDGERQLLPWAAFERSWQYLDQMALEITSP